MRIIALVYSLGAETFLQMIAYSWVHINLNDFQFDAQCCNKFAQIVFNYSEGMWFEKWMDGSVIINNVNP